MKRFFTFCFFVLLISCSKSQNTNQSNEISEVGGSCEEQAEYPGGMIELNKFIKQNLQHHVSEPETYGKVYVSIEIDVDGSVINPVIKRSLSKIADEEVIKLIKKMPKWKPAKDCNGNVMKSKYILPVKFE